MKRITILLEFYRKNIVAVLLLFLFMATSLFYMIELLGYLYYQTYSLRMMDELGFTDGVYAMAADGFDQQTQNQTPTYDAFLAQEFAGVENVVNLSYSYSYWNGQTLNIMVCDQDFLSRFSFSDEGDWFTQDTTDPSQPVEIVVGGAVLSDVSVGDTIILEDRDENGQLISQTPTKVIGKDVEPTMLIHLGYIADNVSAENLFSNCNNLIYMTKEGFLRLYGSDISEKHNNFLVTFRPDATEEERQQVLVFLHTHGRTISFDEIRTISRDRIIAQLRNDLPRPLFMLGISVFAMISVSVLLTAKQMKDYPIYYLVGYSRRRSFFNTFVGILGISGVAGGVNLLYLFWLNQNFVSLKNSHYTEYYNYLVPTSSALYILLFILLSTLLSMLIPFAMLRKHSSIELYRRPS